MFSEEEIMQLKGLFESARKSFAWELRVSMRDLEEESSGSTNQRVYGPLTKTVNIKMGSFK